MRLIHFDTPRSFEILQFTLGELLVLAKLGSTVLGRRKSLAKGAWRVRMSGRQNLALGLESSRGKKGKKQKSTREVAKE